jgi:6-methylsalicylate decarboxylase
MCIRISYCPTIWRLCATPAFAMSTVTRSLSGPSTQVSPQWTRTVSAPPSCPDVRFIVSHGGGTIPYLAPRFAPFMAAKPGEPPDLLGPGSKEVMEMLRLLYFDLAASTHHGALSAMLQLMPASQLLLGFDFPFMPPATVAPVIASLESFEGLSSDDQQAIASGNARRLLPKVGAR